MLQSVVCEELGVWWGLVGSLWIGLYWWPERMGVFRSISSKVCKSMKNVSETEFSLFTLFVFCYSALSNLRRYGEIQH